MSKRESESAKVARLEAAHRVAYGAWVGCGEGVMQLPGNTEEEREFNRAHYEFLLDAWRAFCVAFDVELGRMPWPARVTTVTAAELRVATEKLRQCGLLEADGKLDRVARWLQYQLSMGRYSS